MRLLTAMRRFSYASSSGLPGLAAKRKPGGDDAVGDGAQIVSDTVKFVELAVLGGTVAGGVEFVDLGGEHCGEGRRLCG